MQEVKTINVSTTEQPFSVSILIVTKLIFSFKCRRFINRYRRLTLLTNEKRTIKKEVYKMAHSGYRNLHNHVFY